MRSTGPASRLAAARELAAPREVTLDAETVVSAISALQRAVRERDAALGELEFLEGLLPAAGEATVGGFLSAWSALADLWLAAIPLADPDRASLVRTRGQILEDLGQARLRLPRDAPLPGE